MDLSSSTRNIDSKGSTANRSLSSALAWRQAVIAILRSGANCRSFCFSPAPVLIVGSTAELLVGCSGGQFARHWSGS